jgi:uncharacterized protein YjbI with pentapeptide repeats
MMGSFSSSLCVVLFAPSQHKTIRTIQSILIITLSILVSWLTSITPAKSIIAPLYSVETRLVIGCLFGLITAQLCLGTLDRNGKPKKNFDFLRDWAINFSTLKSTSFYNLDLSNLDLTNAKLANVDFRARKIYRTCLKGVTGLERARVDNRYLDLDQLKVQQLLTRGYSDETDFSHVNLQGAYLKDALMQRFDLTQANLNGANLSGADLRDSILLRSQVTGVDFSTANLTGICIQDWSVNSETNFSGVQCDYVYREFHDNRLSDRYPSDRNFKPSEFESLFQKLTNAVELVFQDQIDWRALSFTFEKFRIEDDGMGLELKGIEQRGDYWIVKVTHGEGVSKQLVEQQVHSTYDDLRALMESKDRQINQLLGIVDKQAEALTNFSEQPLGNSFFITGSTIKNLAGSGQIEYHEAADQVRSLITNSADPSQVIPILQSLFMQLSEQKVATTSGTQLEFIQQLIVAEAENDQAFKQFLTQHEPQIISAMPSGAIATAIQSAIQSVNSKLP